MFFLQKLLSNQSRFRRVVIKSKRRRFYGSPSRILCHLWCRLMLTESNLAESCGSELFE